ncbi:MAG: DUF5777 family beta-barrel protein [Bacteroidales bacterium]|nr:DUF5777 family beta-barrel protein [Bacteroidales bacterium]
MKRLFYSFVILGLGLPGLVLAQDLDQLLDDLEENNPDPRYVMGTFEGTTIINGQSVELPGAGDLNFRISHRFGAVNLGIYEFFGLDQASTRFAFEYGIKDIASLSIGRSTYEKTYDGAVKIRLLRQQTGIKNIPVTVTVFSEAYVKSIRWDYPERDNLFTSRLSYATQVLVARKFGEIFSLQLSPTYVHKNLVPKPQDQNNIFAMGAGGRLRLTPRFAVNAEYFYLLPGQTAEDYINSLSVGIDIETGGHIFQLQFTNSRAMFARGFVTETTGEWLDGDIFFGFNLYRVFPLGEKRRNLRW